MTDYTNQNGPSNNPQKYAPYAWIGLGLFTMGLLLARAAYPDLLWLTIALAVPALACLITLLVLNRAALRGRTAAYGVNSLITVLLVLGILGIINFLALRYPLKGDLTKDKLHTLSDQTVKVVKGLKTPVKAAYFATLEQRERNRPLLENFKALNPKFELEYVNPSREPSRTKAAGIKRDGTLQLTFGTRENKVEEVSEEKITNALLKITKEKTSVLCPVIGHGEKSFSGNEAEGYDLARKGLASQAYEVKDLNLMQEGKVPDSCDAIALLGPTKGMLEPEVKIIADYLNAGGRAIIALDLNLKGSEYVPQLQGVVESWFVRPVSALVLDPISRMLSGDAAIALLVGYSKDHPITRDFQANCYFPFARPLEVVPGAPASLKVEWLGQTSPKSFGLTDLKQLSSGQVRFDPAKDKAGPLNAAIAVSGKRDEKAAKATRLVVFGSSFFASNAFAKTGGNLDFFLNSVSWAMEDESLISIRPKEETAGRITLTQTQGRVIQLVTVVLVPLFVAIAGIVVWLRRRRL